MKQVLYAFLFIFLTASTASSEEWKLTTQNTDMHIGESFCIGNQAYTLTDIAKNSDGNVFAVMFTAYENNIKTNAYIVELGKYAEINEGSHRLCLNSVHNGQLWCSCDYLVRPVFIFSSETTCYSSYNTTVVSAKLYQVNAKDVRIKYTLKDITLKGSKPAQKSYDIVAVDSNITNMTIKWKGTGTITLKATYEDTEGNKYEQTYNVLKNTVIDELKASGSPKEVSEITITTSKVSTGRVSIEKKIFKNAITRAMKYIDFSEESKTDLNRIINEL
jgi:hypothetical protein